VPFVLDQKGAKFMSGWTAKELFQVFLFAKLAEYLLESQLARMNFSFWNQKSQQTEAQKALGIADEDMKKSIEYSTAKYRFGRVKHVFSFLVTVAFLAAKGLPWVNQWAEQVASTIGFGAIGTGVLFLGFLVVGSQIINLPFALFHTFVIEEKFGFNKQNFRGFCLDLLKGFGLAILLGGPLLAAILWIMAAMGAYWWVWAWALVSGFSLMTAWIYPTFLAPLFNKFSPLEDGELKTSIYNLAQKVGFSTDGIYVMDASKRSAHGNAYFTGVFGKKRIVLFDTLIKDMGPQEVTAVLAHELGHFKLHHVRNSLLRGLVMSFVTFYLLGLVLNHQIFYESFGFTSVSHAAGLVVFSMWFGLLDFALQPIESWLSRRNEFAADAFASAQMNGSELMKTALLKLREKSFVMPISHPLYSAFYHSHPPMLERIQFLSKG
jgi:STE24 endopeptidase